MEKRESDFESKSSDYYNTLQPLPSPGPLLGNTRLVDAYAPPAKKQRSESVPTGLRSLEEINKYPRPNSLQMFGGEVRILDNTGETKTMRIEPRQTNSPTSEHIVNSKCVTSETASIVVRSGLHSGGTMVHKPPGTPTSIPNSSISLPNTPQMLAPIIPNISTPSIAPSIPAKDSKLGFKTPGGDVSKPGSTSPKVPSVNNETTSTEKYRRVPKTSVDIIAKANKPEIKSPNNGDVNKEEINSNKFLRPTSLPLKPDTFTPKKHHGITPTANTLPLISPETPRPKKSYGQLYLNGHAYTYLGLKCSTRVFYCTLNRPQPMYVTQQHGLSMYSNWKICKESPPDVDMAHYDSRHRPLNYTTAWKKQEAILTHSSQRPTTPTNMDNGLDDDMQEKTKRVKIFDGGFESNEDYTYIRGRGRGRYVCEECGIRCKKPSMLKKHIRTHTDVRPYTCEHCAFSFKTKGNLTKHMKSKAHYKKCVELGIVPVPTAVCDDNIDKEAIARLAAGGNTEESSEEEEESDGDESEESGSEEQEAAQSLLSLSQRNTNRLPGLLPSGRPTTYPYTLTFPTTSAPTSVSITVSNAPLAGQGGSTQGTTVVRNELPYRYYFPSSRTAPVESRTTVIQSSKKENSDLDVEEVDTDSRNSLSQPMDLTTKPTLQPLPCPIPQRAMPADILTPVSEPILLQTIVQTMERLPIQGREWKPNAEGHMLQAYLTERHVMDSKIKQQYRVGNTKLEKQPKERDFYVRQLSPKPRSMQSNNVSTLTYTASSKMQQTVVDSKIKHVSKHTTQELIPPSREFKSLSHDLRSNQELTPLNNKEMRQVNVDNRPPSRDMILMSDYRHAQTQEPRVNFEMMPLTLHEASKMQEATRSQNVDMRSIDRVEMKHTELTKQTIAESIKHTVARKMVVGGPGFRSPSPTAGNTKPQAEFLQPSSGPAPNYVR
ncbi:Zinc finger protein 40 [Dufourea novaeangliae]|uniref:Zinc finger protein 40 n=1 Tax=Dufourea novaeangliae TaxID=178035 RepID=A0A154P0G8_DUFNO|nr:Zinc finger protein 40 [Dufourea novaeangliae]